MALNQAETEARARVQGQTPVERYRESSSNPQRTPSETQAGKRAAFVRLANARTGNVLLAIRRLQNCANKSSYAFDSADWDKILGAITNDLQTLQKTVIAALSTERAQALDRNAIFNLEDEDEGGTE